LNYDELKTASNLSVFNKDPVITQGGLAGRERSLAHGFQKLFVILGTVHFIEQKFHRLDDTQL
jgi:hypothetical protein